MKVKYNRWKTTDMSNENNTGSESEDVTDTGNTRTPSYTEVYGVKLFEKNKVFVIIAPSLARSPTQLTEMGGRSRNFKRWAFLHKCRDDVMEWLRQIEEGDAEHDFDERQKPEDAVLETIEVSVPQPQSGQRFRVELRKPKKGVKGLFERKITHVRTSGSEVITKAFYKEKNSFLHGFGSNMIILHGDKWQLDGFRLAHKVVFIDPRDD